MAEVIVLGSGPSGLMAAHAAETCGHEVVKLYDADPKEPDGTTAGVFYLHRPCGLNVPSQIVKVSAEGDKREYARRVYGNPDAPCNWPEQPYEVEAWDGMGAVQKLWWRYQDRVEQARITSHDIQTLCWTDRERLFISTIPLDALVDEELPYTTTQIVMLDTDPFVQHYPHMIYMGVPGINTTRRSYVFGSYALEAPMDADWSQEQCGGWYRHHVVRKVMHSRDADQYVTELETRHQNLLFTGRYGRWSKSMLTHRVFDHVIGRLGQ